MLKTSTIESSAVIYRDSWEVEEFIINTVCKQSRVVTVVIV